MKIAKVLGSDVMEKINRFKMEHKEWVTPEGDGPIR
jgi:hypothetical protein